MNALNEEPLPEPEVKRGRRISVVWIIPLVALLLGLWLVKRYQDDRGEVIIVTFENAEGLEVDKTKVKCRDVEIGEVEAIDLTEDLKVEVGLRIRPQHTHLIRSDSNFWVTRARIRAGTVSGLGTILSGAYVEVEPGEAEETKEFFVGLETPPLTPLTVPGLRMELTCTEPGSVGLGSGVYFKNTLVGKVESRTFDPVTEQVTFGIFIEEQFQRLVTTGSRFWIGKALQLNVGAQGVAVEMSSVEALFSGKISFDVPDGADRGQPVEEGDRVILYASEQEAEASSFVAAAELLLLLKQSVRGLSEGAAVEYRGLRVGRVQRIAYDLVTDNEVTETPVLIALNQHLLEKHFPPALVDEGGDGLLQALQDGLKASLKSSNLLTGQVFVDLDYYPDLPVEKFAMVGSYPVLPTVETGLERLEDRLAAVLDKINDLPLESLLAEVEATAGDARNTMQTMNRALAGSESVMLESQLTLRDMQSTLASLEEILDDDSTRAIPADIRETLAQVRDGLKPLSNEGQVYGDLRRTLDEMRAALRSVERMTDTISEKPNSLLFGRDRSSKLIPRAKR
ncbi:MAG: MlaD family protein [Verrucomicrobiota bacterium JB023]|nr:MlaD family protein [Verrucomicrobiota bacterium JB023]